MVNTCSPLDSAATCLMDFSLSLFLIAVSLWNVCCHFSEVDSYSFGIVLLLPCSNYVGILLLPTVCLPSPAELRNGESDVLADML